jgi:predicted nicotinamide N-methyase
MRVLAGVHGGRHPDVELEEERVEIGGRELRLLVPPDAEALLDEEAFEREEYLPYWAELWPSGVRLARALAGRDLRDALVLELGCGLGVPSITAALAGAAVLATDWSPHAIDLLRTNAERNGTRLEAAVSSWLDPRRELDGAPWDLVLAADVLYERRNTDLLLDLLPRLGAEVLLADPGRPHLAGFLERAAEAWEVEENGPIFRLERRA